MKLFVSGLIMIGLASAIFFGVKYVSANENSELYDPFISSTAIDNTPLPMITEQETKQNIKAATSEVDDILNKYAQEYPEIELSIEVFDLTANKKYQYNPDRTNIGASTTKVFAASAFLSELEKGKYTYDTKLGTYNTKFQLQQLVKQSNNISWELFYTLLGRKNIQSYTHGIGSINFNIEKNSLKVTDMTNYLQKLVKNELHTEENTKVLLSYMQETYDETFVPDNLPGFELYHKNGQLEAIVNEAIIAVGDKKTITFSIYTDGKDKWEYTKRRSLIKGLITDTLASLN